VKSLEDIFLMMIFFEHCALLFLESRAWRAKKPKGFLELGSRLGS
jgi:hypothetical protein